MFDIHSHLIPNVDDGPPNLEEALLLCRAAVEDGITHAICTPHILPGRFNNSKGNIFKAFEDFKTQVEVAGIKLTLGISAEVRMDAQILNLIDKDQIPFLGTQSSSGFRYMLLELPDAQIPVGADVFIKRLMDKLICPVIVHPERNRSVFLNPAKIQPFVETGCQLQVTASSLLGQFGPAIEKAAWQLIENGSVKSIASDCHNLGGRRPRMKEAREAVIKRYGQEVAKALTESGPAELCA
jgi:protein-tyrosine phosphatase